MSGGKLKRYKSYIKSSWNQRTITFCSVSLLLNIKRGTERGITDFTWRLISVINSNITLSFGLMFTPMFRQSSRYVRCLISSFGFLLRINFSGPRNVTFSSSTSPFSSTILISYKHRPLHSSHNMASNSSCDNQYLHLQTIHLKCPVMKRMLQYKS